MYVYLQTCTYVYKYVNACIYTHIYIYIVHHNLHVGIQDSAPPVPVSDMLLRSQNRRGPLKIFETLRAWWFPLGKLLPSTVKGISLLASFITVYIARVVSFNL